MAKQFVTVAEAAKAKGCSRQAIHAAIKADRLKAVTETVSTVIWKVESKSLAQLVINPRMKRDGRPRKGAGK